MIENKKKDDGDDDIDYLLRTTTTSTYTCTKLCRNFMIFWALQMACVWCGVYYKKCSDLI